MPFESLRFHNFRNIRNAEIPVDRRQVFFIGENGQGKTNFLEAVYTLCYGKSFRSSSDQVMVTHGLGEMAVIGRHRGEEDGIASQIRVVLQGTRKEITLDGKAIGDRKQLVERFPCVVFCHDDLEFVRGGPECQRLFFDQTASLMYPEYLANLRDYQKTLKARNALLKEQRSDLLLAYDEQLLRFGYLLMERRTELVRVFNQLFGVLFEQVSGGIGGLAMEYRPNWPASAEAAREKLQARLAADLALKSTTSGAHRDRFAFLRDGRDFVDSASTGQFRLMSLLMRLCQASLIGELTKRAPILLLDDVLLELDFEKRKRFLERLPPHEQAFYTFLPDESIRAYASGDALVYHTEAGGFIEKGR